MMKPKETTTIRPKAKLLKNVFKCPDGISTNERLTMRLTQLNDLAEELEAALDNHPSSDYLRLYPRAISSISIEIKMIMARKELQTRRHH